MTWIGAVVCGFFCVFFAVIAAQDYAGTYEGIYPAGVDLALSLAHGALTVLYAKRAIDA